MRHGRRLPSRYPVAAFADTSGLYALLDRHDANHRSAVSIFRAVKAAGARLVLTNIIRAEAHALILNRLGHAVADRFLTQLEGIAQNNFVRVTEADELGALALLARYHDQDFSLTDAISFVVMERLGITHAFSFDANFRQYGWTLLSDVAAR